MPTPHLRRLRPRRAVAACLAATLLLAARPATPAADPQLVVDIDRDKARSLGLPLQEITDALQVFLGRHVGCLTAEVVVEALQDVQAIDMDHAGFVRDFEVIEKVFGRNHFIEGFGKGECVVHGVLLRQLG